MSKTLNIYHAQTINQLTEKTAECDIPLSLAFLDYVKAFDLAEQKAKLDSMCKWGANEHNVRLLQNINANGMAVIRLHKDRERIRIDKGVRQGDTISPKLFTSCLEGIFRELDWERKGLNINGEYLNHLRFANDIILISETAEDLQEMVSDLN